MTPKSEHQAFYDDLIAVLRKHGEALTAKDILAVASYLVGQLVAMQDQRTMSPKRAMEIVARNLEQGNREMIDGLLNSKGSA